MLTVEYHLDKLDILKEYMKYWIESQDCKRKQKEMAELNPRIKVDESVYQANEVGLKYFGVKFETYDEAGLRVEVVRPIKTYPFRKVVNTFNLLQDRAHKNAKQMIIDSIHKFI